LEQVNIAFGKAREFREIKKAIDETGTTKRMLPKLVLTLRLSFSKPMKIEEAERIITKAGQDEDYDEILKQLDIIQQHLNIYQFETNKENILAQLHIARGRAEARLDEQQRTAKEQAEKLGVSDKEPAQYLINFENYIIRWGYRKPEAVKNAEQAIMEAYANGDYDDILRQLDIIEEKTTSGPKEGLQKGQINSAREYVDFLKRLKLAPEDEALKLEIRTRTEPKVVFNLKVRNKKPTDIHTAEDTLNAAVVLEKYNKALEQLEIIAKYVEEQLSSETRNIDAIKKQVEETRNRLAILMAEKGQEMIPEEERAIPSEEIPISAESSEPSFLYVGPGLGKGFLGRDLAYRDAFVLRESVTLEYEGNEEWEKEPEEEETADTFLEDDELKRIASKEATRRYLATAIVAARNQEWDVVVRNLIKLRSAIPSDFSDDQDLVTKKIDIAFDLVEDEALWEVLFIEVEAADKEIEKRKQLFAGFSREAALRDLSDPNKLTYDGFIAGIKRRARSNKRELVISWLRDALDIETPSCFFTCNSF